MSINTDVRKYGETVLEQGKVALDEARKPWLAAVGATDLAYDRLRKQVEELPAELRRLRDGADAAQLRTQAREAYATTVGTARETYETLAHRGDLVVRRLRRRPEVADTFAKAEQVLLDAEKTVVEAEEKVTRPAGTTRKAPARKATASTRKATPAK